MHNKRMFLGALALTAMVCLIAVPALAQNPTGSMTGRVTADDEALPGVTVKIASEALPGGSMVAVTGGSGEYLFRFLPAGTYTVTFALDGFHTLDTEVKISVAATRRLDAEMQPATVSEEIVVTGAYETVTTTSQGSVTFEQSMIDDLPIDRDMQNVALIAPGVADNAPNGLSVNIAGAPGSQTLWMVNGVVVNDNVWGNPYGLYVEDAVEETTVAINGVSAEYGRFTGGVINMVTKSGGNEFSGSYRLRMTNDSWEGKTPLTTSQEDTINNRHEATLGGYFMKDHLWFFGAFRSYDISEQDQYYNEVPYPSGDAEDRWEGKLTIAPHISHRILGSYMKVDRTQNGSARILPLEPTAVIDRKLPQTMYALNYTGVITENFFVEAQYSQREFTFQNSGGTATPGDRINGTGVYFYLAGAWAGSHLFCSSCPGGDEERNNENMLAKGSLFLSTGSTGSHDLVFGYDSYNDILTSNNYQSPSNFVMWDYQEVEAVNPVTGGDMTMYGSDGTFYPVYVGGEDLDFWPILLQSRGTDFTTDSLFVNDTWRLNKNWTFNLGVRYDKNDGQDGIGNTVSDSSRVSPRLGVTWDIAGDGEWMINASFGRYVASMDSATGGDAGGGSPSYLGYTYGGPTINIDENGVYQHQYTTPEAMQIIFDWFDSVGGLTNTDLWYASPSLSGINLQIPALDSPYTDEISLGFVKRLGNKGLVRADYVYRTGSDFYIDRTDTSTGTVSWTGEIVPGVELSEEFDLTIRGNDSSFHEREYHGILAQFQYRFNDRLMIGGNYTWSHLYGNFDGENTSNGISVSSAGDYPEFQEASWRWPYGDLGQDQRHNLKAYLVWDLISTRRQNLTLSWLESFHSGTPYGAFQNVPVILYADDPGYLSPPTWESYYFANRDTFRTDDIHSTDLSLNYSFFVNLFGSQVELYIQPEIQNVFNEQGVWNPNTSVVAWYNNRSLHRFDPFDSSYTPVEGPQGGCGADCAGYDWYKGSAFGTADSEGDYQDPRIFRLHVGFRF